jgi:HD-GYP domain-containing protein (c-di-GMP phosphodiesterase class II)
MGLSDETIEKIHVAAHLHDIGKIGVTDVVLNKSGKLLKDEIIQMQSHSLIDSNILTRIDVFKEIANIVLHHHERFDGTGYPDSIGKEAIPLESRLIAVADSFDAITSDRLDRPGSSYEVAFNEIGNHVQDQFCPVVFKSFDRVKERIAPLLDATESVRIRYMAFVGHEDLMHSQRVPPGTFFFQSKDITSSREASLSDMESCLKKNLANC